MGPDFFLLLWCGSCFGVACWLLGFSWLPGFLASWLWFLGLLVPCFLVFGFLVVWLRSFLASWLFCFLAFWQQHRELLHLAVAAAADAAAGDPCHQALNQHKREKFT